MPCSGALVTRIESGRPDGSLHGGAGSSTGTSDSVDAVAVSALHCGGGTDRQVTVTPAMHGCQSTTVTPGAQHGPRRRRRA